MGNLNKMIVIGNLASKPRMFNDDPNKQAMITGRVAANDYWNDAQGNKQKRTTWFNFVMFGKRAEAFFTHNDKGACVYLEGDMREDTYTSNLKGYPAYNVDGTPVVDANGAHFVAYVQVERTELKLYVRDWKFMDSKPQGTAYAPVAGAPVAGAPAAAPVAGAPVAGAPAAAVVLPAVAPAVATPVAPPTVAAALTPATTAVPQFAVNAMPTGV
jgi:hypothetical protein